MKQSLLFVPTLKDAPKDALTRGMDKVLCRFIFTPFNKLFAKGEKSYAFAVQKILRSGAIVGVIYIALLGLTGYQFHTTPTAYVPGQDKQYLVSFAQLPDAASLDRTEEVIQEMSR